MKKNFRKRNNTALLTEEVLMDDRVRKTQHIKIEKIIPNENNIYPIANIEELAESIATVGLEQNLVVKETTDPEKFVLLSGHRRLEAIKYILDNNIECKESIVNEIKYPLCLITKMDEGYSSDEEKLVEQLKIHSTNVNIRHMTDAEKIVVCENYLKTINEIKEKGILINGKRLKGTSRELVAEAFGLSKSQAQKLMSITNGDEETKNKIKAGELTMNQAYENKSLEADPMHKKNAFFREIRKTNNLIKKIYTESYNAIVDSMTEDDFKELCEIYEAFNHYTTQIKIGYKSKHS